MKLTDRIWLALNKREPRKWNCYVAMFFSGMAIMFLLLLGLALISSHNLIMGCISLLMAVVLTVYGFISDYRRGYVEALFKKQRANWEERRNRLLKGK